MRTLREQASWCTRIQYVLGGSIVLMFLGFYLVGMRPKESQLRQLREQIVQRERELNANQARANNLPVIEMDVEMTRVRLERFDKKLPKQQELGQFIREITQLSNRYNLRKLIVQPGVHQKFDLFAAQPISLNFEGDFLDVFTFLRQTEGMQRLTRVQSISVRCVDSKLGTVEVQLSMNIYFMEG